MIGLKTTIFLLERDSVYPGQKIIDEAWSSASVALDPHEYEEPKRFLPERFLNEDLNKPLAGHWSFGMGRRGTSILSNLLR